MIDYGSFQFAAAPFTGQDRFNSLVGGIIAGDEGSPHIPFLGKTADKLRVSTVRHPCDWLWTCFCYLLSSSDILFCVKPFSKLLLASDDPSFDEFVNQYLAQMPGAVGRLVFRYRADTFLRAEDFPGAVANLLLASGISPPLLDRPAFTERPEAPDVFREKFGGGLWSRVVEAERELCDWFDYW